MVFSSVVFLFVFLPIVLLLYYVSTSFAFKELKNGILLAASLLFYAWGEPVYLFLMLASTVVCYFVGLGIGYYKGHNRQKMAKLVLLLGMVLHIGSLVIFKYTDFFVENFNRIFHTAIKEPGLTLPIGISFYTFQILSYLIDAYWGKVAVQKNWLHLATYVALFPQLIAGPIVRYETVEQELDNRKETMDEFALGARRFIVGLGKKVLIANTVGELYTVVHALPQTEQSVLMLWLSSIAYTIQIYYDFSGYSDMAIGLGRMFGFHFLENFNYPYIATSITEVWRRWHISLSSWFRDYVYIPLGGNRCGAVKLYRNIFVVWLLTGFWHGAEWTFVGWGLYFCLLLVIEKSGFGNLLKQLPMALQHIYTMVLVVISWTMFASNDMGEFFTTLKGMFFAGGLSISNERTIYYLASYGILFVIAIIGATPVPMRFYRKHIKVKEQAQRQYLYVMGSLNTRGEVTVSGEEAYVAVAREKKGIFSKMIHWEKKSFDKEYGLSRLDKWKLGLEVACIFIIFIASISYLVSASFNPFLYFRF